MQPLFKSMVTAGGTHTLAPIVLDGALKGALVLTLAAAAAIALRRAAAARRHAVWALALIALCILPLFSAVVPGWRMPLLPESMGHKLAKPSPPRVSDPFRIELDPEQLLEAPTSIVTSPVASPATQTSGPPPESPGIANIVLIIWAAGASIVFLRFVASRIGLWRKGRRAVPLTDSASIALAERWTKHYRIGGRVSYRLDCDGTVPATWGFWRPVVLLPADHFDWPPERIRAVLLHELAHVARRDFVVQTLARLACALHWFNPLAWYAQHRLRVESEHASDDLALNAGLAPAGYASQLVELLASARRAREVPAGALAMARASELEDRVQAILDGDRTRAGLSRRAVAVMIAWAVSLLFLLGLVRIEARAHEAPLLKELPEGMTIELLGISTYPSDLGTWWAPDGKPLAEPPCDPIKVSLTGRGPDARVIVVRIKGVPEGAKLNWHPTSCYSQRTSATRKGEKLEGELQVVVAEFVGAPAKCDLHFDLPFGEWKTEQTWDGTSSQGIGRDERGYYLSKAREIKNGTAVAVAHNIVDSDVRVIAVEHDGRNREPTYFGSGGSGHLRGIDAEFDLIPAKIREYQIQTRRLGRYEIKNVALRRGAQE